MHNKNTFSILLKIIATLIMLVGIVTGLSAFSTADSNPVSYLSVYVGILIIVGSTVFFLLFFALGEIINILHDIRNEQ